MMRGLRDSGSRGAGRKVAAIPCTAAIVLIRRRLPMECSAEEARELLKGLWKVWQELGERERVVVGHALWSKRREVKEDGN
jgi:hypothetical protein